MKCPRCSRDSVRVKVEVFVDVPFALYRKISKRTLRTKHAVLEGANWPETLLYCTRPTCGWSSR